MATTPVDVQPGTVAGREPDAQVRAIARAVDRNSRRTDELIAKVRQLAGDLATLSALIPTDRESTPTPAPGAAAGPPAVRSWLLVDDPAQAVSDLAELLPWVDRVYLCFPDAMLAPCWLWHPHVVEELWWLFKAHAEAYDPEIGSWLRVGDWHDRQRPGVARRVRDLLVKCDLSLHIGDRPHARPLPHAPMAGAASAVATAWAGDRTRPGPTAEQLDEATAHMAAQHRRR